MKASLWLVLGMLVARFLPGAEKKILASPEKKCSRQRAAGIVLAGFLF